MNTFSAQLLHSKIATVCPIDGISMGDPADANTWRIDFAVGATPAQIAAAQAQLAAVTPTALAAADATVQAAAAAAAIPDPLATARASAVSSLPSPVAVITPS